MPLPDSGRTEASPQPGTEDDSRTSAGVTKREIMVTPAHRAELKARKAEARISESDQIRLALMAYLKHEPQEIDRFELALETATHRKLVPIADSLWDQLRARKDDTGFDLDEQVQLALNLYFRAHTPNLEQEQGSIQKGSAKDLLLSSLGVRRASDLLPSKGNPNSSSPLNDTDPLLLAARIVLSNAALEATNSGAVSLVSLPSVPCGPWREAISDGTALSLPRELADILGARPGDLLVPTDGQSMVEAGVPDGGRVVMRPLNGRRPRIGEIVLCCIEREDGMWESTIKFWFETPRGVPLLKNGKLQELHLPADLVEVHPVATLVGIMGRATFGTSKGLTSEARAQRRRSPNPDDDPLAE